MTNRSLKKAALNCPVSELSEALNTPSSTLKAGSDASKNESKPKSQLKKRKISLPATGSTTEIITSGTSNLHRPPLINFNFGSRLLDNFFDVPCEFLARGLLGQILVRTLSDGKVIRCKIVETECYLGGIDKASHSYNGKVTERNTPMYMKPGTSYVYFTYGMYHCFNISSQGAGAAVLLRAAEPLEGLETMQLHRQAHQKEGVKLRVLKSHELCNGPSKLCMSLGIERFSCNRQDLSTWDQMWLEKGVEAADRPAIVSTHRIGIDRVGPEWGLKPLRFYLLGNSSVSKRDKVSEQSVIASIT